MDNVKEIHELPRGLVIRTKFMGCTNHRPSRCKAYCLWFDGKRQATLSWDHGLDGLENHAAAAMELAKELSDANKYYDYRIEMLGYDDGDEYVFVARAIDVQPATTD